MKADQRLRVFAEPGTSRSAERPDDFPLGDCANLAARLFKLVKQPGCFSGQHSVISSQPNFYRKGREGRKGNRKEMSAMVHADC